MALLDFTDIFDFISEEKDLQWISVPEGEIKYRNYVRGAEANAVSFRGWFVTSKTPLQKDIRGTNIRKRYILRFDPVKYPALVTIKPKDFIIYDGKRFLIDAITVLHEDTAVKHYECIEADT